MEKGQISSKLVPMLLSDTFTGLGKRTILLHNPYITDPLCFIVQAPSLDKFYKYKWNSYVICSNKKLERLSMASQSPRMAKAYYSAFG
jgi:hypothetical protein